MMIRLALAIVALLFVVGLFGTALALGHFVGQLLNLVPPG